MTVAELDRHRYASVATYRRNGAEVATPVWFAAHDGRLYVFTAGDSGMELGKNRSSFFDRLAFEHLGHQRGRRGRYRAAATLERDIGDLVAVERQVDRHPVAAQGVVALGKMRRMLDRAKVARMAPMIEDDILIEFAKVHHRANISRVASIAAAN